ncbi:MAG: hypothetical protein J6K51_05060 [Clostridia bacterium]|nr:hypothetical protein [Clostridia bacterium]
MGAVKSQLVINDGMTSALRRINKAMGLMLSNFEAVQRASGNSINTANLAAARQEIGRANAQLDTMEENYRNINNQQNNLNRGLGTGSSNAEKLLGKIKNIAATYIGMQGLSKLTGLSDTMTSQRSRLALIVDDGGSVAELLYFRIGRLAWRMLPVKKCSTTVCCTPYCRPTPHRKPGHPRMHPAYLQRCSSRILP